VREVKSKKAKVKTAEQSGLHQSLMKAALFEIEGDERKASSHLLQIFSSAGFK
jgi:hypothetical protein